MLPYIFPHARRPRRAVQQRKGVERSNFESAERALQPGQTGVYPVPSVHEGPAAR